MKRIAIGLIIIIALNSRALCTEMVMLNGQFEQDEDQSQTEKSISQVEIENQFEVTLTSQEDQVEDLKQDLDGLPLINRALASEHILINCIPKTGTHLVGKCLFLLTGKRHLLHAGVPDKAKLKELSKDNFFSTHTKYTREHAREIEENNYKCFFILRDWRDQLVSFTYWVLKRDQEWPGLRYMEFNDLLMELIERGAPVYSHFGPREDHALFSLNGVDKFYRPYFAWMKHPAFYTVKFENLVGPKGGGTLDAQLQEIKNIARHIGIHLTDTQALKVSNELFGGTWTFREGKIGDWKNHFKQKHIDAFKKRAGQFLIYYGKYEKDNNW
ncbi:MAG TPA: hypothetical protein VHA52_05035 [Candidatus Babeliaceae bacterium]|nr:hypothetical protein [Candidatus Babeliaceae bacterium]